MRGAIAFALDVTAEWPLSQRLAAHFSGHLRQSLAAGRSMTTGAIRASISRWSPAGRLRALDDQIKVGPHTLKTFNA